jgi:GTP-binding protein YchF
VSGEPRVAFAPVERLGLVGLPNSGKSSLFNAVTGGHALVAAHPFSTTETTIGVAQVPDPRLLALAAMSKSKKVVHTGFEVVDIAGLVAGAGQGEGLGNRFLGGIREVDALCLVLRSFVDEDVPGEVDPLAALAVLELELVLADLSSIEVQLTRQRRAARADPKASGAPAAALEHAAALLEQGTPLYRSTLSGDDRALLRGVFLLTNKPVLVAVNLGEDEPDPEGQIEAVRAELAGRAQVLGISVRLEAEAAELDESERAEMLGELGLGEGALARMARAAYHLIGRRTFFTTGDKESRAWTFRAGARAPECAGVIHSDLQRGFIRAEVIDFESLLELGSWTAAKAAGRLRIEGKDYEVIDGDVLEIRYNV